MYRNRLISEAHFEGLKVDGDLGVEVEVEGDRLPTEGPLLKKWRVDHDHSLRGNSLEYVFRSPLSFDDGMQAIDDLYKAFRKADTNWKDTTRAGIHVHVNVRDLTEGQVLSFVLLFIVFEEAMAQFCGEERVGNLFCMRAQDAEYLLYCLRRTAAHPYGWRNMCSDKLRYSAVNPTSVVRYGSLEFRGMKAPVPKEVLKEWCQILVHLRDVSVQFESPLQIISGVSEAVGGDFARQVLGEGWANRLEPPEGWEESVKKGMRNVQPVARTFEKALEGAKNGEQEEKGEGARYRDQYWDEVQEAPQEEERPVPAGPDMPDDAREEAGALNRWYFHDVQAHLDALREA